MIPEELIRFYQAVFGWRFTKKDGCQVWQVSAAANSPQQVNGMLFQRGPGWIGEPDCIACLLVTSIEGTLHLVVANGGQLLIKKTARANGDFLAFACDPQGTPFALIEMLR
jgi:uncharacterized protein